MKAVAKHLPIAAMVALQVVSTVAAEKGAPLMYALCLIALAAALAAAALGVRYYFTYAAAAMAGLVLLMAYAIPSAGGVMLKHAGTSLYIALMLAAALPPLMGLRPFTRQIADERYPEAIRNTPIYRRIHLTMTSAWAALLALCALLSLAHYSADPGRQGLLSTLIPVIVMLGAGISINKLLPDFLRKRDSRPKFTNASELLESMPLAFNKGLAGDMKAAIQFDLKGEGGALGYISIDRGVCTYSSGQHPHPDTTIRAEAALWLSVSNGEVRPERAYMQKLFSVEGDHSMLMRLNELFGQPKKTLAPAPSTAQIPFAYGSVAPGSLQRVLVIDGGPRSSALSKSMMMAREFALGAMQAGAEVRNIKLSQKDIRPCRGCYSCWTSTPGLCVIKDDMAGILQEMREADLIVFASPLYYYSVTALMKAMLERMLPDSMPYLKLEGGLAGHPARQPRPAPRGMVVMSAAGFPQVEGNFDGISGLFRSMHRRSADKRLMGEFYLPGAEMLAQPVFSARKNAVLVACRAAGHQAIAEGRIEDRLMAEVSRVEVGLEDFVENSNVFWELALSKRSFAAVAPRF